MSDLENRLDQGGPQPGGGIFQKREVESITPNRTDIDLIIRIFFHPIAWTINWVNWDPYNGYGIKFGPILIKIAITKHVNVKFKKPSV